MKAIILIFGTILKTSILSFLRKRGDMAFLSGWESLICEQGLDILEGKLGWEKE